MTAMRVLIVDDEPLARQRLRHLLAEIPGTEVVGECGDGTDAARAIGDLAPDVVLLDVQMREMGGFALVDAVGAARHGRDDPHPVSRLPLRTGAGRR